MGLIIIYNWIVLSSEKEGNLSKSCNWIDSFTFLGWRHIYLQNTSGQFENGWYKYNNLSLDTNVNNSQENFQDLSYYWGTSFGQIIAEKHFFCQLCDLQYNNNYFLPKDLKGTPCKFPFRFSNEWIHRWESTVKCTECNH